MADDYPAFLFNVEEFFGSMAAQRMSFSAKGVYLVMLFQQWRSKEKSLPDSAAGVADLIAISPEQAAEVDAAWDTVRRKFVTSKHTPGRIYNVKIEETRRKQRASRKSLSERGKSGGEARAKKLRQVKQIDAVANVAVPHSAIADAGRAQANPSDKREKSREEKSRSEEREIQPVPASLSSAPDPFADKAITERAGRFIERYQALYQQHRHGARYVVKPARDYAEAVTVCSTWDDDARLEKLATIFLTTDHHFAEEGSRTIGQFRSMASWCDGRLAEAEAKARRSA